MKFTAFAAVSAVFITPVLAKAEATAPAQAAPSSGAVITATPSTVAPLVATPRLTTATANALPANTEIWLSPNQEVNSKRIKQGQKFDMTVARDVMLGDYVVIPRGARGHGQITYRTGKGAFGKSAKMEFEINEVEVNNQFIPLQGHYRVEGQGNTGATVGTAVAVGVFSAFVTGRSAVVAQGTEYKAFTVNPIPVKLADAPVQPLAPASVTVPASGATPAAPAAPATPPKA